MRFRFRVLLILTLAAAGASARPQQSPKPLTMSQVADLTKAGMDSGELAQKVKQMGIDFDVTDDYLQSLRKAGAQDVLINALREARPQPLTQDQVLKLVAAHVPSQRAIALVEQRGIDFVPEQSYLETLRVAGAEDGLLNELRTAGEAVNAQIEINTSPHAEVYLDGQLAGTAGDNGQLGLKLKPGAHSLRVTLAGKKDYLQTLSLTGGHNDTIDAGLVDIERPATKSTLVVLVENSTRCPECWQGEGAGWVKDFLPQLPHDTWVAVVVFSLSPQIVLDFARNTQALGAQIGRTPVNSFSESNLFDALAFTADRIKTVRGKKSILVVATGLDTFSKLTYDQALNSLQQAGVSVYGVEPRGASFNRPAGQNALLRIGPASGGKTWIPAQGVTMPDVHEVAATVGAGLQ
jgi:hypothetical protein